MEKPVLGHIDCPTCGTAKRMRITHDKNGDPFGYCALDDGGCGAQLRIGGRSDRVRAFVARYPWAAKGAQIPVTVTEPDSPVEKPADPVTVPEEKPEPKAKAPWDLFLGK